MREFTARFATAQEIAEWDSHVTANPAGGNLLQSEAFAEVKKDHGWTPRHVVYEPSDGSQLSLIHISEPTRREWLSRMPSSA